jgi:hypothetical protein
MKATTVEATASEASMAAGMMSLGNRKSVRGKLN